MRQINATVTEYGRAPYPAEYLATRNKDGKMYMEVRTGKSQYRKWVSPAHVKFKLEVTPVYVDKVSEIVLR